ncbi:MAG: T9SS type B sorting domain-containing protein, partial [Ferruginibacter sp.]
KNLRICAGKSADLSSLYNVSGLQASWTFNQLAITDLVHVNVEGTYQLIAITNSGCADTVMVNLGIQPEVFAHAGDDSDAEYNVPYQLSGAGNGNYQWSPTYLLSNPFIANPFTTLTNDQTFTLMVIDEIGCFALDTVKLRVLKGPTFYVPSAFTPDNDGLNDIFKPTTIGIKSLEYFRVFNRFGEMVYETHKINEGWNGIYKGIKQPVANYVWSLKGTDRTGKVKMMKGNVVLIR